MADFNSKYTGEQVENLLDQIANGEIGGSIETESDPIFSDSPAASITEAKKAEWDNKVDKVSGKQLSTEDFTTALKTKLEGLSNYDDTELSNALSTLRGDFDKLVSGDTTTAIKTFNEIIAFLDGIADTENLASIIASIEQQIAAKQDKITDLDTIRSGAAKGATALQEETYKGTVTGVKVNGETKSPSDGVVDLGSIGTYSKPSTGIPNSDLSEELREKLETAHRNAMAYQGTVTNIKINGVTKSANNGVVDLGNLGTYSKPSTGIPKSDLNPSVQTSLGKADTAVQPADIREEVYIADFTMESLINGMNNSSQVNCDMQALVAAMNANKIILVREFTDSYYAGVNVLNGYAEDLLYFSIVDSHGNVLYCDGTDYVYDKSYIDGQTLFYRSWDDKQDKLQSGTNIKTINGESILGSGNITINGGGSSGGGKEIVLSSSLYFNDASPVQPNKIYISNSAQTAMYIGAFQEASNYDEYCIIFKYPEEGVTLPESVKFANGQIPTIEYNTECELSVVGIGSGANRTYHAVITPFKTL